MAEKIDRKMNHGTFFESGNVYIETKRNVDPYIVFYVSLRGRMARKSRLVLTSTNYYYRLQILLHITDTTTDY